MRENVDLSLWLAAAKVFFAEALVTMNTVPVCLKLARVLTRPQVLSRCLCKKKKKKWAYLCRVSTIPYSVNSSADSALKFIAVELILSSFSPLVSVSILLIAGIQSAD